jgi:3-phenylpropionate/trans-cinnamate dioxygenase ferredoxin reductase subunit
MNHALPLVIAGASYAGLQIAASARELGFQERIYLVGDEPHAPYQRPPLSKGLLTGKVTEDQLPLRSPEFFSENRIELLTGVRVASFDPSRQRVALDDGTQLQYGWLALATGASPRKLNVPGGDLPGVFSLRTLDDARAVARAAEGAHRVCVIGGGYIGLEVAAALRGQGRQVVLVQSGPRVLSRSMPALMSAYVQRAHGSRGVDVRTAQRIRRLHSGGRQVAAVELEDGSVIDCDLVVLGIGVDPNTGLAAAAGLSISNGIDTDAHGRTSAATVLAAGDVACMQLPGWPGLPARMRLESIQAANDGAKAAAATIAGRAQPCTAVPWFWSDQFDLKFQMAGIGLAGDHAVVRGDMESDRFSVGYLRQGALAAMHSVNRPAEHMLARKLISARARISPEEFADPAFDLKSVLDPQRANAPA